MRLRLHLLASLVVGAAAGCGLTLDLDPTPPATDAGTPVEPRDSSIADASFDAARPPFDAGPMGFDAGPMLLDAGPTRRDAGAGCPRNTHWPADGTCGRVLFSDAFESPTIDSDWVLLRTEFEVAGGHLESRAVPRSLPTGGTFAYGHTRNGRGGLAVLNVDEHLGRWTNYRVDWTQKVSSTDEAFPGGVPPDFFASGCDASAAFFFRVQVLTESWNEPPGSTFYNFGVNSGAGAGCEMILGDWSIGGENEYWIPGTGWWPDYEGFADLLFTSSRVSGSPNPPYAGFTGTMNLPHDYAIEVSGLTIDAWVDGTHLATYTDSPRTMMPPDAGTRTHAPLTYGGIAFTAAFDEQYWIDDVVVTEIP